MNIIIKAHPGVWRELSSHRSRFPLSTILVRWSTPALSRVLTLEKEGNGGGSEGEKPLSLSARSSPQVGPESPLNPLCWHLAGGGGCLLPQKPQQQERHPSSPQPCPDLSWDNPEPRFL